MLRLGRCRLDVAIETLMMIDSLRNDRCRPPVDSGTLGRRSGETRIVITHGTDSMEQTAAVLGRGIRGKTIVLTGAMVPYKFGSSDGMFNLGTALAFVQALEPGVYVAMNGRCFPWHSVRKNRELGIFDLWSPQRTSTVVNKENGGMTSSADNVSELLSSTKTAYCTIVKENLVTLRRSVLIILWSPECGYASRARFP